MATTLERNAKAYRKQQLIERIEERIDVIAVTLGLGVVVLLAFTLGMPG